MKSTPKHIDRDSNGNDISYIRKAFKERRRLKKELGTSENSLPKLREMAKGRPPKSGETRKPITLRLTPTTIERIKTMAAEAGCSQSDVVENFFSNSGDE